MRNRSGTPIDPTDRVWKALADPTRRATLDVLREAPCSTGELCARFPHLSRFAVMKHLTVLERAGLVIARREGRVRRNLLNVVPIQQLYERWMRPYESVWASGLLALKRRAESAAHDPTAHDVAERRPERPVGHSGVAVPAPSRSRARSPDTQPRAAAVRPQKSRASSPVVPPPSPRF
jgi:DNA-binding transcriptional ArsR family regulator